MPTAEHRSDFIAVLLRKRVSGSPQAHKPPNRDTKKIEIRLTEEEYNAIKAKSVNYSSVSHYVRSAVKEYSNISVKQKLRLLEALGNFYREYRNELSHISGNLNQSAKRTNELSISGHLTQTYISQVLIPEITRTRAILDKLSRQLLSLTKLAFK